MVDLIRQIEYSQPIVKSEQYRSAISDEVSEPDEFQWDSGGRVEPITRLRILDKSKICLAAIREKYRQTKSVQADYKNACILWKHKEK